MEEVNIDRKSFYEFLELLFNKIDPVNRVNFKTDNKRGYKKIDNDKRYRNDRYCEKNHK